MSYKIKIEAAFSKEYENNFKMEYESVVGAGGTHEDGLEATNMIVRTARAQCGRKEDRQMLRSELLKHGSFTDIDAKTTEFRRRLTPRIVLEVAHGAAKRGKPQALIDLTKLGDLEAVDMLHEVAENGEEHAHDALFEALQSIAMKKKMSHGWYEACWRDRDPVCQLVTTLLHSMANMQHHKSLDFLLGLPVDSVVNDWLVKRDFLGDNWDWEAYRSQHAALPLQIFAKQGNQRAWEKLVAMAKKTNDDASAKQAAQKALTSLAEQWDRRALKVLIDLAKDETDQRKWPHKIINKCKNSLHSFG